VGDNWANNELARRPSSRRRRLFGLGLAAFTIVLTIAFVAGVWNPWRLVILADYFGNPTAGIVWVLASTLVSVWVLGPVVSEAAQHRRVMVRFGLGAMLALSIGCFGLFGAQFGDGEHRVVATSPDGQRKLVLVSRFDDRTLRIWSGTGLGVRDAGYLGLACGAVTGRFDGRDKVHVSSLYGEFDLRLEPATGRPIDTIGPTCVG
jgi:hypothetical protein